jgi:hypothetical protein
VWAVALLALFVTGACEFADRKHESEALVNAGKRIERIGSSTGVLMITAKPPSVAEGAGLLPAQTTLAVPPLPMQLRFAERVAHVGAPAFGEAVYAGPVVYLKRVANAAQQESQFGFRDWSRLDFSKIKRKDRNTLGAVNLINPINPTYLVRLLRGTLSGSVRRLGTATVNGTPTTHYRMNVDRSKAYSRLGDKDRQAVDKAFSSNNFKGSVLKHAEAWIGADGLPRRFRLQFHQKFTIKVARDAGVDVDFPLTYTIELSDFGKSVTIDQPRRESVARVDTLNALLESVRS